jgi:anti-sigma factor ChrR (cupin superfamily)
MTQHQYLTDDLRDTVLAYALGTLASEEVRAFAAHLATGCRLCVQELQAVERTIGLFGHTAPAVRPPPQVRSRLFAALAAADPPAAEGPPLAVHCQPGFLCVPASTGDWRPFRPGIQVKVLFTDSQTKRTTALVRMAPGTYLPRHQHLAAEELFVLEGDCHVAPTQILRAGDYFRAEAGSMHETTFTEGGTTFLTLCWNEFPA